MDLLNFLEKALNRDDLESFSWRCVESGKKDAPSPTNPTTLTYPRMAFTESVLERLTICCTFVNKLSTVFFRNPNPLL